MRAPDFLDIDQVLRFAGPTNHFCLTEFMCGANTQRRQLHWHKDCKKLRYLRWPRGRSSYSPSNGQDRGQKYRLLYPASAPALPDQLLEEFKSDDSGTLADYIPELKRADPAHFGVAVVTIDGHVYEVGDSAVPFTIQSVSKAFVFALALELVGEERVSAAIGVEPSGEAFNSIRLTNDNRPFNPMVNAGAIACSGLIHQIEGAGAFECIREKLSSVCRT